MTMNILLISSLVYILCCHKVTYDFRFWIYKQSFIVDLSNKIESKINSQEHFTLSDSDIERKIIKRNWFMPLIYEWITCYFCAGFWLGALYFICKIAPHSPLSFWILSWHLIRFSLVCAVVSNGCCNIGEKK